MIETEEHEIEVDNSEEEMFPRTSLHYELDEVLFIMDRFIKHIPIQQISDFVQRAPRALVFKFLEYRPIKPDGSLLFTESVRTLQEALTYSKEVNMYSLNLPGDYEDLEDAG